MIWTVIENKFRYAILLIGCACLTSISSNMLVFNIAQVCMTSNETDYGEDKISLEFGIYDGSFDYTPYEISLINWAVAFGTACAALPFSELYVKFGAKWPFFAAGLLSIFSTMMMPLAAELNFHALLAFRFLQGVAYAADFAAVGALCSNWASLKQNGLFLGVLTSYSPLSSGFTNWLGGMICNSRFGWPMIFYVHGVCGFIVFMLWCVFYCDKPQNNKKVSVVELQEIQRDKNSAQINGIKSVPYKTLMSDIVIITIWASAFAEIFSTNFLAVYSPYYIRNVLGFSSEKTGNYSALSRVVQIPVRLVCGQLSDRITFLSEDIKLILFNTITVAGAAFFYATIGYVPEDYPLLAVVCFTMVNVVTGAASGGFYKCAVLYARQYSHFVIATCQLLKCAALFLGPAMVAAFVSDATSQSQWKRIFLVSAAAMLLASIMFCKFSSSKPPAYVYDENLHDVKKTSKVTPVMENGSAQKVLNDLV